VEVYEYFARNGWKVVAIDYRLGLKPLIEEPDVKRSLFDFRAMLVDAIDVATEDLLEATAYLVANSSVLGIDPEKIVTLGASAGAITVCQAEWALCNSHPMSAVLPANFDYAGLSLWRVLFVLRDANWSGQRSLVQCCSSTVMPTEMSPMGSSRF
jgi:hypothetical protein